MNLASLVSYQRCPPERNRSVTAAFGFGHDRIHRIADRKAGGFGSRWEFLEAIQPFGYDGLRRHEQKHPMGKPVAVFDAVRPALKRIGAKVVEYRAAQFRELPHPHAAGSFGFDFAVLLHE